MADVVYNHDDYTIGWICPLEVEQIAALEMLDEEHPRLPQPQPDHNVYTLGSIAGHNVVIAGLCAPGNNSAATAVTQMRSTFPNLRFGLLVGIGGGVPTKTDSGMIRVGDVVVSKPMGTHSGLIQYDRGKAEVGHFKRTGYLAPPPVVLLNAAQDLASRRARSRRDPLQENLNRIDTSIRGLRHYKYPGTQNDHLYQANYPHSDPSLSCEDCGCDATYRVKRPASYDDNDEEDSYPVVHRGIIASGGAVIKDSQLRDQLAREHDVLCFEMEAAGILTDFPCLVIRGISDYCDSHKNNRWHGYAAAVAAAYARQLFFHMPILEVKRCMSAIAEKKLDRIVQHHDDRERQDIIDWLSLFDYTAQQNDFFSRRQDRTGQWLLQCEEFRAWQSNKSQTLFCPGIPGAGKTILASTVVKHFQTRYHEDVSVGLAYIYCNFRQQEQQKPVSLLTNILKQLILKLSIVPTAVKSLYSQYRAMKGKPTVSECVQTLVSVTLDLSQAFIVIDALDECQISDGDRTTFLREMIAYQAQSGANLLVTSRFIPDIEAYFEGSLCVEIRASEDDVRTYLASRLAQLPSFVLRNVDLQNEIMTKISGAVDGMFLLAHLHLDFLIGRTSPKALRTALKTLPKSLDESYDQTVERIDGQIEHAKEFAYTVLSWIVFALRPLTTTELSHALAVEPESTMLDPENVPEVPEMLSVCAGLVTVDEESNIIRLVHFSTQEYLQRLFTTRTLSTQTDITSTCLTYLSFDCFASGPVDNFEELQTRFVSTPLFKYCAQNWGNHARGEPEIKLLDRIIEFLSQREKVASSVQAMTVSPYKNIVNDKLDYVRDEPALVLAASFGLTTVVSRFLDDGVSIASHNSVRETALLRAARNGHDAMVKLLVDRGADMEGTSHWYGTALFEAAGKGEEVAVRTLLSLGADVNGADQWGWVPLHWAAENGAVATVSLLLSAGANIEASYHDGRTALSWAAAGRHKGCLEVVKYLLEKGANVHVTGGSMWTPLHCAISRQNPEMVAALIDHGANLEARDKSGATALQLAAREGDVLSLRVLLARGANPAVQTDNGCTLLMSASESRSVVTLKQVLDTLTKSGAGVDPDDSEAAFIWALWESREGICRYMLEEAAGFQLAPSRFPASLLTEPVEQALQIMLQDHPNFNRRNSSGETLLMSAAYRGQEDRALMLLRMGADVNAVDNQNQTATWKASVRGHLRLAQILFEYNADVNIQDVDGRSPLLMACAMGHMATVVFLVFAKADVNARDQNNSSPLLHAARRNRSDIVEFLSFNGAMP